MKMRNYGDYFHITLKIYVEKKREYPRKLVLCGLLWKIKKIQVIEKRIYSMTYVLVFKLILAFSIGLSIYGICRSVKNKVYKILLNSTILFLFSSTVMFFYLQNSHGIAKIFIPSVACLTATIRFGKKQKL